MARFILKRLLIGLGTIVFAFTVTFLLVHASDASPGSVRLGFEGNPELIDEENERLGWNRPLVVQYVEGLGELATFDLGTSLINSESVADDLQDRLPVTASIAALATLVSGIVGTVLGVTAAVRGRVARRAVEGSSAVGLSLPSFWIGVIFVYVFAIRLGWLPATGYAPLADGVGEWLRRLALPVLTLSVGGAAIVARTAAVGMRDALASEHITTLRAVGTPEWRIRYLHALRHASLPIVAILGVQFIVLFGGSVIIENLFALPGLGQAALAGAQSSDFPSLVGVVVVSTTVVVLVNLALDLLLVALDPKLRTR